jgi:hypothetical protein
MEDRGDGVKRLYRFPVVFPADAWQVVMPHALMCYGSSQLKYWSEYSQDGRNRHCMTYEKVPVNDSGQRIVRLFGGRKRVLRPDNEGRCDPESCREYQTRQCNLSGRFIFLIPGIPSIRAIELSTNSFYSMAAARETLETVALLRGGRISGFLEGKTSFWITKELREIAMIGEDGEPRRVEQWLIKLEAPVDLTRLLRVDDDAARASQAERAVGRLTGATAVHEPDAVDAVATNENCEPGEPATAPDAGNTASTLPVTESVSPPRASPPAAGPSQGQPERRAIDAALGQLFELIDTMQVPREPFERYAKKKYGPGWSGNPHGVRRVRAEVDQFRDSADALRKKIDNELDVFA